ncbi:hypothetical protein [Salinimicrobium sp. WS361]|uniref:hypothetical protein n=1 Tax=Salinimicrobium sp. WS361 TaxID=3425123 RepID=UPI003D6F1296
MTKEFFFNKSLLILPIFAALIYSCSPEEELEKPFEEIVLDNDLKFVIDVSEDPFSYAIITKDGLRDTLQLEVIEVRQLDYFKTSPAKIDTGQNDIIYLNRDNLSFSFNLKGEISEKDSK